MYYLQSRYYDPEVGRFLNADTLVSTGQGILGNNMFTYCLNNPVSYSDHSGNSVTAMVIGGAVAGALISLVSYLVSCGNQKIDATIEGVFGALIAGAIAGGFGGMAGAASLFWDKVYFSALAAIVAGMYTEMNGGSWFWAMLTSFGGNFLGSWIDTSVSDAFCEAFATYAAALLTGTQTEIISSIIQIITNDQNEVDPAPSTPNVQSPGSEGVATATVPGRSGGGGSTGGMCVVCYP